MNEELKKVKKSNNWRAYEKNKLKDQKHKWFWKDGWG